MKKLLEEKKKFSRTNKWGKCSYKALIIEAIEQRLVSALHTNLKAKSSEPAKICFSPQRKMTLNEIYDWIVTNIDFFKGEGATNSSGESFSISWCIYKYFSWMEKFN